MASNGRNQSVSEGSSPWSRLSTLADSAVSLWFETAAATARMAETGFQNRKIPDADPVHLAPTAGEFAKALAKDPVRLAASVANLWLSHFQLASHSLGRQFGIPTEPAINPKSTDLRFRGAEWQEPPFYNYVMQAYLLNARWLESLVESADFDDVSTRRKAIFSTRIVTESLAPANIPFLNPVVARAAREQYGRNFVEGMRNWLRDIEAEGGRPRLSQVDESAFEVGETVAITPGKVIWRNELFELIQYSPTTKQVRAIPTLFVPPWINKYYILDLVPKKSMVKWLVARGHTVFLMSWVNPDERHRSVGLEDMLETGLYKAIDMVLEESGSESVNLVGYCIGGTLAGLALAHLNREDRRVINTCTFFASQFDFSDAGDLMALTDHQTVDQLSVEMRERGFLPASAMSGSFNLLRPGDLFWSFVIHSYLLGLAPEAFDLLYWNSDSTRMAARLHEEYLRAFYLENRLAKGTLEIGGAAVDLGGIDVPTYHVVGQEDHIAPPESVYRGMRLLGGETRFVLAESGHIAGIINPPAARKYGYFIDGDANAPDVQQWAETSDRNQGSWWKDWIKWLNDHSRKRAQPREAGAVLGVLEDAPGSYVRVRHSD